MSYVVAVPEFVASAASDLAGIGSAVSAAHAAAAAPTTGVVAAASDEVSAAIASLFSGHGHAFQTLSTPAAAFHDQFVQALNAAGGAYTATEAANASPLQTLWPLWQDVRGVINLPTRELFVGDPVDRQGGQEWGAWDGRQQPAGRAGCCSVPAATAGPRRARAARRQRR